jgi:hypothetical protein
MKLDLVYKKLIKIEMKKIYFLLFISCIGVELSSLYYISKINDNIMDWYYLVVETLFGWLFAFAMLVVFLQHYADPTTRNIFTLIISLLFVATLFIGPCVFFYVYHEDLR